MPSFDIVSQVDLQEIDNIVNSVVREIGNRYDFKGVEFAVEFNRKDSKITINAASDYALGQLQNSLKSFAVRRNVDPRSLEFLPAEKASGNSLREIVNIKQGLDKELAKKIIKIIKETKLKVQATICDDEVRVTGKNIDDLQQIIGLLKTYPEIELPLQFINFRN